MWGLDVGIPKWPLLGKIFVPSEPRGRPTCTLAWMRSGRFGKGGPGTAPRSPPTPAWSLRRGTPALVFPWEESGAGAQQDQEHLQGCQVRNMDRQTC